MILGIKDLNKQVPDATETRKEEQEDYVVELAANTAPVELLGFAKNRLNKFYNPKVSMEKVIKVVDGMVVLLGEGQEADDATKEHCEKDIGETEDKHTKSTSRSWTLTRPLKRPTNPSLPSVMQSPPRSRASIKDRTGGARGLRCGVGRQHCACGAFGL